jgi:hypothetical protein
MTCEGGLSIFDILVDSDAVPVWMNERTSLNPHPPSRIPFILINEEMMVTIH